MAGGTVLSTQDDKLAESRFIVITAAVATAGFPRAVSAAIAPLAATPNAELRAIDHAAFTKLKHAFLRIRPAA